MPTSRCPLSPGLVGELLERLDLHDVVLVGNDTGGALVQLLAADGHARVGGIVLVSCDAFDNFPPGLTGRTLVRTGKLPPRLFGAFMQQMRLRPVRRLPIAFGWLTKRGDAVVKRWLQPLLHQPEIRRDAVRMLRAVGADKALLVPDGRADRGLRPPRPHRLGDRGPRHAARPRPPPGRPAAAGQLVEVADSYTLIPLDQPADLARAIRTSTRTSGGVGP